MHSHSEVSLYEEHEMMLSSKIIDIVKNIRQHCIHYVLKGFTQK